MSFRQTKIGPWRAVEEEELARRGVRHGFLGTDADFSTRLLPSVGLELCALLGEGRGLVVLDQVHGHDLVEVGNASVEALLAEPYATADGLIIPRGEGRGVVFGIRTADCLPILLEANGALALVHAGWRGLSKGIVRRAAARLLALEGGPLVAAIGPAAGPDRYEVGPEVVEAFDGRARTRTSTSGQALLDLASIAAEELQGLDPAARISFSHLCTISSPEWHSHRRQGSQRGMNLAFVAPSAAAVQPD